jgi:nucleoside-triphosphatase
MPTLLLTGEPGIGKTTVLRKVVDGLPGWKIRGFLTEEIRVGGRRQGFRMDSFTGPGGVLAHVEFESPHRVGKYGVDVSALDQVVESTLRPTDDTDIYLIDEIGRMECFSAPFVSAVETLLESDHLVVATIHHRAGGFVQRVKSHSDTKLWEMTRTNRDSMPERVLAWVRGQAGAGSPVG